MYLVWFSCQVVNDRMTEIRNENEDLKSAAVIADELYQKVLAEKGMLEMDLNRAKQDKNHLVQQACYYCCTSNQLSQYIFVLWFLPSIFCLLSFFSRLISAVAHWMSAIL